jgi:hypothetical protein
MIHCSRPGSQVMNQMTCMVSSAGTRPGPSRPPPRVGMRQSACSNPPVSVMSASMPTSPIRSRVEKYKLCGSATTSDPRTIRVNPLPKGWPTNRPRRPFAMDHGRLLSSRR